MAIHNALGKAGEDAVAAYLEHNGYVIRDRNWRKNRLELDIVATKDNRLIIVEVKTRSKAKKRNNIGNILGYATTFSTLGMMVASIANLIKK